MIMRDYRTLLRPRARGQCWTWLAALVIVAGAGWGGHLGLMAQAQAQRSEAILQQAIAKRSVAPAPKPTRSETDIARRWQALAAERAYSWYPVFHALEQASSSDIELLEFLPDKASGKLLLRGEARNVEALTSYVSLLARQDVLSEVHLAHQKNVVRGSLELMTFEVRAQVLEHR